VGIVIAGVKFDLKPLEVAFADIARRGTRANQWALREAGRQTKRVARRKVRVYGGKGNTTNGPMVKVTTGKKVGGVAVKGNANLGGKRAYGGKRVPVVPGELRDSIASSKRLAVIAPSTFRLSVGPRGGHVHLYAAKIEALDHYMEIAAATVIPKFPTIQEKAMARVLAKYGNPLTKG
jgi:hypothetical protein